RGCAPRARCARPWRRARLRLRSRCRCWLPSRWRPGRIDRARRPRSIWHSWAQHTQRPTVSFVVVGMRLVSVVVGALIAAVVAFLGLLLAGLRWQVGPALDIIRRMNRTVTNPRVMRTAGTSDT